MKIYERLEFHFVEFWRGNEY